MKTAICVECEIEINAYDSVDLDFARYCHDMRKHNGERRTVDMDDVQAIADEINNNKEGKR